MLRTTTPPVVRNVGRDRWLRLLNSNSGAITSRRFKAWAFCLAEKLRRSGSVTSGSRSKQVGLVWIRAKRQSGAVWSRQQRLLEEFQLRFNRQRRQCVFARAAPVAPYTFRGPVPQLTLSRQPAHMLRVPAGQGSHFTGSDPMLFHHLFGPLLLEIALQNFVSWIALSW